MLLSVSSLILLHKNTVFIQFFTLGIVCYLLIKEKKAGGSTLFEPIVIMLLRVEIYIFCQAYKIWIKKTSQGSTTETVAEASRYIYSIRPRFPLIPAIIIQFLG